MTTNSTNTKKSSRDFQPISALRPRAFWRLVADKLAAYDKTVREIQKYAKLQIKNILLA